MAQKVVIDLEAKTDAAVKEIADLKKEIAKLNQEVAEGTYSNLAIINHSM